MLSLKAYGLYYLILAKGKEGFSCSKMLEHTSSRLDAISSAMRELKDAGVLEAVVNRKDGKIESTTIRFLKNGK